MGGFPFLCFLGGGAAPSLRKQYSTGLAKKKDVLQFFLQNIENPEFSNLSVFLHKTFRGILGEKVKNKKLS
ncbi:MAG TPA: hypothetical protein IAA83_09450 [Candidatus Avoscillospira avistercoris]|uniref:Uncharacterized protein n=1 Tax=Candidatus Avoscillospira avistercoris TaxID=2840707 RepID=A0A9D1FBF4_9FIRM|nr:hypothetical protein [Candidatus Avoscillospira avistercoris]